MHKPILGCVAFLDEAVQGVERQVTVSRLPQRRKRIEKSGDSQAVPVCIAGVVDIRGLPLGAGGDEFLTAATEQTADLTEVRAQDRGHDVPIPVPLQQTAGWLSAHLPPALP